jgi:hypothetical protein
MDLLVGAHGETKQLAQEAVHVQVERPRRGRAGNVRVSIETCRNIDEHGQCP